MADVNQFDTKLLDPAWYTDDAYLEGFKLLRDEDPVHWTVDPVYGKDYWAITRYEDLEAILLDDRSYSNRWETHVPTSPERITAEDRYNLGFDVGMPFNDNPIHDQYRRPINKHFSVAAIGKLSEMADRAVEGLLEEAVEKGEQDVVTGLALDIPTRVVLRWFGIPDEDWDSVQSGVRQSGRGFTPKAAEYADDITAIGDHNTLWVYASELAADRMESPRDDFLSTIAHLKIDGGPISHHEVTSNVFQLIEGALGNTRNAIAMGLWLFAVNPDQRELLRSRPELMGGAVEEIIRYGSNSPTRLRIATHDTEYGGKEIAMGDWVVGFMKSANFDERHFENPERFDITRKPNKHLAFGTGVHNCLGRHLAKLEMVTLFSKLIGDYDYELAGDPAWGTTAPGSKMPARMDARFWRR